MTPAYQLYFGVATLMFITTATLIIYTKYTSLTKYNRAVLLPPGSSGLPLIGETLQLFFPSYSLDLPSFFKKRIERYGDVFRTSLAGRSVVISADQEFNKYIVQEEGKTVEIWYLDNFSKLFALEGEGRINIAGSVHKYIRKLTINHFGSGIVKSQLTFEVEEMLHRTLKDWSTKSSVDVKESTLTMLREFFAKQLFGYDSSKSEVKIGEQFTYMTQGLFSFPINIPGTTYYRCVKSHKEVMSMLKKTVQKRLLEPSPADTYSGDFLDDALKDLFTEKYITEDFIVQIIFCLLVAGAEATSTALTLVFKFLLENKWVMDELTAEHEEMIKNKEDHNAPLTYSEVKSMTFTLQVINEILRLGSVSPGLLRKSLKDIQYKGYTIPEGWTIMILTSACHYNPDIYQDPLAFNPHRWKDLPSDVISKNFLPFGGGTRQCAGADLAKVLMANFIHVLITKYRWSIIKGGDVARTPVVGFPNGLSIRLSKRETN